MNAVVQQEKIETIFDHHITTDEFKQLFDFIESQEDYEYALSQTDAYIDLYYLYKLRGHHDAQLYLNKLDEKIQARMTQHHCLG